MTPRSQGLCSQGLHSAVPARWACKSFYAWVHGATLASHSQAPTSRCGGSLRTSKVGKRELRQFQRNLSTVKTVTSDQGGHLEEVAETWMIRRTQSYGDLGEGTVVRRPGGRSLSLWREATWGSELAAPAVTWLRDRKECHEGSGEGAGPRAPVCSCCPPQVVSCVGYKTRHPGRRGGAIRVVGQRGWVPVWSVPANQPGAYITKL